MPRSLYINVVAKSTDEYRRVQNTIRLYRVVVHKLVALLHFVYTLSSEVTYTKMPDDKKLGVSEKFIKIAPNFKEAQVLAKFLGGPDVSTCKGNFVAEFLPYARRYLDTIHPDIVADILPRFDRDILVDAVSDAYRFYTQKDPVSKIGKHKYIANDEGEIPKLEHIGMPIIRYCPTNDPSWTKGEARSACGVIEQDKELLIWVSAGTAKAAKDKKVFLVAEGEFEMKGAPARKSLKNDHYAREILRRMASNEIRYDTMVINEREGKLKLWMSYKVPRVSLGLPTDKCLHVSFNLEDGKVHESRDSTEKDDLSDVGKKMLIHVSIPENAGIDKYRKFSIPVNTEIDQLLYLEKLGALRKLQCNSCFVRGLRRTSSPGKDHFKEIRNKVTKRRTNYTRDRNHYWASTIVEFAKRWKCGMIKIHCLDNLGLDSMKLTWPAAQLYTYIKYKADQFHINVEEVILKKGETDEFLEKLKAQID